MIERRRDAIKTHLFLLCPNNSGSTYLSRALATSPAVWSLEKEGQHMIGFAGPSTLESPWPLIWGSSEDSIAHFRDSPDYDWSRTKRAWYYHASAKRDDAPIFHTKAPPFLLIADQLANNFAGAAFLFMVRNPYAAMEGILRRHDRAGFLNRSPDLATVAARHLVTCLTAQRHNISEYAEISIDFRYEDLCASPQEISNQISNFLPEIGPLDLAQKLAIKGTYDEPLRDMNTEQIARLSAEEIAAANEVFRPNAELLSHFDYRIIET
ncbi:sulfotransferase [Pontixanthobacter gangjinensis]|uniref:Sulfotransferase family protein n=1 Tax=Pontixanthobacter gangjinensis TaxID=1028742 RepID=A0A6I4SNT9_9SPHN|nr:sulfotransferase [Pontixanthobacter gangjinensis]MXO57601.1 hypothetical protein [Pontixanthobacter gangjinensis]